MLLLVLPLHVLPLHVLPLHVLPLHVLLLLMAVDGLLVAVDGLLVAPDALHPGRVLGAPHRYLGMHLGRPIGGIGLPTGLWRADQITSHRNCWSWS